MMRTSSTTASGSRPISSSSFINKPTLVGVAVGAIVGDTVGCEVGTLVGLCVGNAVGIVVGACVTIVAVAISLNVMV